MCEFFEILSVTYWKGAPKFNTVNLVKWQVFSLHWDSIISLLPPSYSRPPWVSEEDYYRFTKYLHVPNFFLEVGLESRSKSSQNRGLTKRSLWWKNKRGGWNKRGGGAKNGKSPNVEGLININYWARAQNDCEKNLH